MDGKVKVYALGPLYNQPVHWTGEYRTNFLRLSKNKLTTSIDGTFDSSESIL